MMKKMLYALLTGSTMLTLQADPLYISGIIIKPNGICTTATARAEVTVTGSGGSPAATGYTFTLNGQTLTGKTVTFTNVPALSSGGSPLPLTVKDSANTVTYLIKFLPSSSGSASLNIDSLPLDTVPGCITLSVTKPTGATRFGLAATTVTTGRTLVSAPASQTFSALPNTSLDAFIGIDQDCNGQQSQFGFQFPFPKGQANALRLFLYTGPPQIDERSDPF